MIRIENITKKYDDTTIFKNFSLYIDDNEFVAITGKSGCGKSTLLNIMGLLESVDKGKVGIDGEYNIQPQSTQAAKVIRTKINYLFQNFALIDEDSVYNNLLLSLKYVKGNKKKRIRDALSTINMEGYENKKIYQLSGGEQQRVALARLFLKPSKIVLADEPTGSLDAMNRDIIMSILKRIQRQGKTVVIVTHDIEVARYCDRIVELDDKKH